MRSLQSKTAIESNMLTIDGSIGEGGGQVLRTSLALSMITQTPFRMVNIRAGRKKPGLQRQHLAAVLAATDVSHARVEGASVGSTTLSFEPDRPSAGEFHFDIGSAGSTTLVLQTVLPALMLAGKPSSVVLVGGTHNPMAPTYDFLKCSFLPVLQRMGSSIDLRLERYGFYPRGGGILRADITPCHSLGELDLRERGDICSTSATAIVSGLPRHIAERELEVIRASYGWGHGRLEIHEINPPAGQGNLVHITIECEHVTEIVTAFGSRRVRAEDVARQAIREATDYVDTQTPVGPHLADQLLLPLALAGRGRFRTSTPTTHTVTNVEVIRRFLDVPMAIIPLADGTFEIAVQ